MYVITVSAREARNENLLLESVKQGLTAEYTVNGTVVKGQATSNLLNSLYGGMRGSFHAVDANGNLLRWRDLGTLYEFEQLLETLGFTLAHGRNRRGNRALVAYVK